MTTRTRALFVTVVGVGALGLASAARSQERPGYEQTGVYVGVSGVPGFTLDGVTFDGSSYYKKENGDEIVILPRLAKKTSMRGFVGVRSSRGAFEVGYEQTTHTGTFLDLTGEATFHSLNFDERIYLLTRGRIQPYGLLGLSIPWLTVKDGSFLDESVGDASFRGFGANTEAGVTVFVQPRVGFSAGYRYRVMWFDSASGVSHTTYKLRPRFRETSGSVVMSVLFTF